MKELSILSECAIMFLIRHSARKENVLRKVTRITHIRLWDGRVIDLGPFAFKITQEKAERVIFSVSGATIGHQTVLVTDGRMTMHTTYHATGVNHTWFAASLADITERIDDTLLATFRARFDQVCRRIYVPVQLQLWGVCSLLPLPIERGSVQLIPGPELDTNIIDASPFQPLSIEAAWDAPAGSMWAGLSITGALKGLVLVAQVESVPTVAFIPNDDCEDLSRTLAKAFAGPTGRIPPKED